MKSLLTSWSHILVQTIGFAAIGSIPFLLFYGANHDRPVEVILSTNTSGGCLALIAASGACGMAGAIAQSIEEERGQVDA